MDHFIFCNNSRKTQLISVKMNPLIVVNQGVFVEMSHLNIVHHLVPLTVQNFYQIQCVSWIFDIDCRISKFHHPFYYLLGVKKLDVDSQIDQ